jgi:capsular polysaccharide biosynthesis protein
MSIFKHLYPVLSRLRPHLGKSNQLQLGASRSWIVSPPERTQVPSAIFDPTDIERITGVTADDTIAGQVQRAQGGTASHGATTAYELRNAVIANGHVFTRKVYYRLGTRAAPWVAPRMPQISEGVLATTDYGIRYFGHWMGDDLPLHLAARDLGRPLSVLSNPTARQRDFLKLLELNADVVEDASVNRLVVLDDAGQNAYKRERIARLRVLASIYRSANPVPGVMLLRGESGAHRKLVNESEIADIARRRGFVVLDPACTDSGAILRLCAGVKIVLGVEGSQLTNGLLWMHAQGVLVSLQPPQRFCMVLKDWCDAIGTRYAFVVGHECGPSEFRIEPDAFQHLLDRLPG